MSVQKKWYRIDETNIYSTGHLLLEENELKKIINSKILNSDYQDKVIRQEYFSAKLKINKNVSLLFFPIKATGEFLMEIIISKSMVNQIENIFTNELLTIVNGRKRVIYTNENK